MSASATHGEFLPIHEAHSIEQVVVAVQFATPLADDVIRSISETLDTFSESLPIRNDIRGMGFQVGLNGVTPIVSPANEMPSGVVRMALDATKGSPLKELRIDRQNLVFSTQSYTRWAAVWDEANGYFEKILTHINGTKVLSYGLTYIDKFHWTGRPELGLPAKALRLNSPYMTPKSFESHDLWHCHSGSFSRVSDTVKRLEVVDIDYLDEASVQAYSGTQRVVRIAINTVDIYNQPGYTPLEIDGNAASKELSSKFGALHDLQKNIVGAIINDELAHKVGLINV